MRKQQSMFQNLDWLTVLLYVVMVMAGWLNIYAAVYNEAHNSILDVTQNYGRQLIWIVTALVLIVFVLVIEGRFFDAFAYLVYGVSIASLIAVLFFGHEVAGSKSWFRFGSFGIQPAEFAKFATALALAKYLTTMGIKFSDMRTRITSAAIIVIPMLLILLENETGVALVFTAFVLVLYREGLSGMLLLMGVFGIALFVLTLVLPKLTLIIALSILAALFLFLVKNRTLILPVAGVLVVSICLVLSVDYLYKNVLEPHQKQRIEVLLGQDTDLKGAGYNLNQSLIAIGSGGLTGKGYLQGTQTKYDFVPEQSTDFIFCTVGEEWGFLGSAFVIILFLLLLFRILHIAERQKSSFTRVYAYGVAAIIFFHFMVNIGMTIGLMPVIGIPLPFFSYGGSSLYSFTILLFILIKLDSYRTFVLR
jgi:rod shape determining protein RodA